MLDINALALCNLLEPADKKKRDLFHGSPPKLSGECTESPAIYLEHTLQPVFPQLITAE
jgi:hypothetical protein